MFVVRLSQNLTWAVLLIQYPLLQHQLPPQSVLRPGVDTMSGDMDSWPAYASCSLADISAIGIGSRKSKKVTGFKGSLTNVLNDTL